MNLSETETFFPDNVKPKGVHPQRFALWLGMAAMVMLFAALTSAYIVRKGAGNWTSFQLPFQFMVSAIIIIISSATMHWTVLSFRKGNFTSYRLALSFTFTLGMAFCIVQYLGWKALQHIGIYLEGNPSGSFIYVISIIHILHVLVGILLLTITFLRSFFILNQPSKWIAWHEDGNKSIRIELLANYWHFVGILWLYLLVFFYII